MRTRGLAIGAAALILLIQAAVSSGAQAASQFSVTPDEISTGAIPGILYDLHLPRGAILVNLTLSNSGDQRGYFSVQTTDAWVQYDAYYNYVDPGASLPYDIRVGLDCTGLAAGIHHSDLYILTDDPSNPTIDVPVTLECGYPVMSAPDTPLEASLAPGDVASYHLNISNSAAFVGGRYWLKGGLSGQDEVLINEVYNMINYSDQGYVELYNASDHPVDISIWRLSVYFPPSSSSSTTSTYVPLGTLIQPGAYLRLVSGNGTDTDQVIYFGHYFLLNQEAAVVLQNEYERPVDYVYFGGNNPPRLSTGPFFRGEDEWVTTGTDLPPIPPGQALARNGISIDTDRAEDWTLTANPTPGVPNEISPRPASWLFYDRGAGYLGGGASQDLKVTLKAAGLAPGDYSTNLVISTEDINNPHIIVPVTLHVRTGAIVSVASSVIDDDALGQSSGNGNMIVEPGEAIEMGVVLKNTGTFPAWNASAVISTADPYVTIIQDTQDFGVIQADGSRLSYGNYVFEVANDAPDAHEVVFNLHITDDNGEAWDDTVSVNISVDSDQDGMPDYWEEQYAACGLDYLTPDADADLDLDGLSNLQEYLAGTDPCDPDTDHDCMLDGQDNPLTPGIGCERMVAPAGDWRIRVTLLEASAALDSDIYLSSPQEQLLIEHSLENVGAVSTASISGGEDLVFFIRVHGEPMGLGTYDHYSNTIFANVTDEGYGTWIMGFEDLPVGEADWDYNDVVVLVELFPAYKHNGVTVNYLGETELTSNDGDGLNLSASLTDPAGFSTGVTIPRSALLVPASVIITNGDPGLYQGPMTAATFTPVNVLRKVVLTSGQSMFDTDAARIAISYPDANQDGFVDGTSFTENSLTIYRYDSHAQTWDALPTTVDQATNQAIGATSHFSLFALGATPGSGAGAGAKHHDSANSGGWFGCSIGDTNGTGGHPAGLLPLLVVGIAIAAFRIVWVKRGA